MIMLDDELCLSVRPGLGCACDTHLAEFSRRIKERSQQMRTDSIARLYAKASGEYNAAQYERAIQTLRQLLLVDQYHENAYDLMVGAKYQLLQKSIKNNTVKESEFEDFLDKYSDSRYRSQVEDQFVTYRLQHLPDKCSYSDISELQAMPVNDKKLQKKGGPRRQTSNVYHESRKMHRIWFWW